MSKYHPKSSTLAGENFEINEVQLSRNHLQLSIMVGEYFEINEIRKPKNHFELFTMVDFFLKCSYFKCLTIILNYPP